MPLGGSNRLFGEQKGSHDVCWLFHTAMIMNMNAQVVTFRKFLLVSYQNQQTSKFETDTFPMDVLVRKKWLCTGMKERQQVHLTIPSYLGSEQTNLILWQWFPSAFPAFLGMGCLTPSLEKQLEFTKHYCFGVWLEIRLSQDLWFKMLLYHTDKSCRSRCVSFALSCYCSVHCQCLFVVGAPPPPGCLLLFMK